MRDHEPLVQEVFRGTFDRGEDEVCPGGFFISSINWRFLKGGIRTRDGSSKDDIHQAIPADIKVRRIEIYEKTGEAQRLLILSDQGIIYDSVTGSPILAIPAMTDFSCTVMYDRVAITPHNGVTGLPGERVYIYEGSGTAKPMGGQGPSASPMMVAVDSALSGKIEAGVHVFAVSFETSTGFLSAPGAFVSLFTSGDHKVDLSQIPLGPPGTTARVIHSTKTIDTPNPDPTAYTYYSVPQGRIANNTATTITVDFYDADLMDDSSYLLENLGEVPAGVGIGQYKSSLIVWGENANPSVIRISKPGQPETHNGADGYLTVYPGIGGGVKNCVEYRNQIVIFKSSRTYTSMDNDDVPATWDIGEIDGSVGTECHGIGQILNIGSNIEDRVFVADKAGLRLFMGMFSDEGIISYNVDDIWGRINKQAFKAVEISVDAINARIYVTLPLDGAVTPTHLLYGDYSEGLGEDGIRWTLWQFPVRPTSIVVALVNSEPVLKFGSLDGYVFKIDPTQKLDNGLAIPYSLKFPLYPVGGMDEVVTHFTGIRLRARGEGTLQVTCEGLDGASKLYCQSMLLTPLPGKPLWRGFNFTSEHCSVTLELNSTNDWMVLTKFILYPTPVWEGRPVT
jgi:hypothetical protein